MYKIGIFLIVVNILVFTSQSYSKAEAQNILDKNRAQQGIEHLDSQETSAYVKKTLKENIARNLVEPDSPIELSVDSVFVGSPNEIFNILEEEYKLHSSKNGQYIPLSYLKNLMYHHFQDKELMKRWVSVLVHALGSQHLLISQGSERDLIRYSREQDFTQEAKEQLIERFHSLKNSLSELLIGVAGLRTVDQLERIRENTSTFACRNEQMILARLGEQRFIDQCIEYVENFGDDRYSFKEGAMRKYGYIRQTDTTKELIKYLKRKPTKDDLVEDARYRQALKAQPAWCNFEPGYDGTVRKITERLPKGRTNEEYKAACGVGLGSPTKVSINGIYQRRALDILAGTIEHFPLSKIDAMHGETAKNLRVALDWFERNPHYIIRR